MRVRMLVGRLCDLIVEHVERDDEVQQRRPVVRLSEHGDDLGWARLPPARTIWQNEVNYATYRWLWQFLLPNRGARSQCPV